MKLWFAPAVTLWMFAGVLLGFQDVRDWFRLHHKERA